MKTSNFYRIRLSVPPLFSQANRDSTELIAHIIRLEESKKNCTWTYSSKAEHIIEVELTSNHFCDELVMCIRCFFPQNWLCEIYLADKYGRLSIFTGVLPNLGVSVCVSYSPDFRFVLQFYLYCVYLWWWCCGTWAARDWLIGYLYALLLACSLLLHTLLVDILLHLGTFCINKICFIYPS